MPEPHPREGLEIFFDVLFSAQPTWKRERNKKRERERNVECNLRVFSIMTRLSHTLRSIATVEPHLVATGCRSIVPLFLDISSR